MDETLAPSFQHPSLSRPEMVFENCLRSILPLVFQGQCHGASAFWGMWIAMLPVVGDSNADCFFPSPGVRANLPLIVALQWISNPFTVAPIYFADYEIGLLMLGLLAIDYGQKRNIDRRVRLVEWSLLTFGSLWIPSLRCSWGAPYWGFPWGSVGFSLQRFGQPLQVANNAKPMNMNCRKQKTRFLFALFCSH